MDHRKELDELFSLYSLGLLSGEDLKKVEEHIRSGCRQCLEVFKETELALSLLPYGLDDVPLSTEIIDKVWDKIEISEKEKKR